MGIGIGQFLPWENVIQANQTGIWSLGMGKNVKNKKWEWDLSAAEWDFQKKWAGKWELVPPSPQDPL